MSEPIIGIILAGGEGTRLWPLTQNRSKPAVPIAGKFRLIDIPISNCLHSEIRKIFILTQFNSESLNRHIAQSYSMPTIWPGFIQILAAQQTRERSEWYQGTADAVRQHLINLSDRDTNYYIILAGDQFYRMDYRKIVKFHKSKKADITICVSPVYYDQLHRFGVLKLDEQDRVVEYVEKPRHEDNIEYLKIAHEFFKRHHIKAEHREFLASMGIYVFSKKVLFDVLKNEEHADFAGGIFPELIYHHPYNIYAYTFDGYWEDIGTIRAFFDAMLNLTLPVPPFNFYDARAPIFTHPRFLPGAKIQECKSRNSIICEGAIIQHAEIYDSVVGIRSIIRDKSYLSRVIMMGADYYEFIEEYDQEPQNKIQIGIGQNCLIEEAIIDKNACIGNNVKILKQNRPDNLDEIKGCVIKNGIVIVPKNVCLDDGTEIP